MTMKITNAELIDNFIPSLRELSAIPTPTKATGSIVDTLDNVDVKKASFDAKRKSIIETRAVKEGSQFKTKKKDVNGRMHDAFVFPTDEIEQEVENMVRELALEEVEVDVFPITKKDIEFGVLSAQSYRVLKNNKFITEN